MSTVSGFCRIRFLLQFKGDETKVACSYKKLPQSVQRGNIILAADGNIVMRVMECRETYVSLKYS